MAYISNSDLIARHQEEQIVRVADHENAAASDTTITAAVATAAIIGTRLDAVRADAQALVDGHLRKQYSVPLDSAPQLVVRWTCDIAIYFLYDLRGAHFKPPPRVEARYRDAIKMLERVQRAELDLGIDPPPDPSDNVVATTDSEDRLFTLDTLEDM